MGFEPEIRDGPVPRIGLEILPATLRSKVGIAKSDRRMVENRDGAMSLTAAKGDRCCKRKIAAMYMSDCASESTIDSCLVLTASMRIPALAPDANWTGILARLDMQIEQVRWQ